MGVPEITEDLLFENDFEIIEDLLIGNDLLLLLPNIGGALAPPAPPVPPAL